MPPARIPPRVKGAFLEELARTLDVGESIRKAGITEEDARRILTELAGKTSSEGRAADIYEIYIDGASRGNPGPSGAGAVIRGPGGRIIKRLKKFLGRGTNNRAEYSALIMALEAARRIGARRIRLYADSELVVRQLAGRYRVKSEDLRPLFEKARALIETFDDFRPSHIPREKNSEADALANEAIDSGR